MKKFLPDHLRDDSPGTSEVLPLGESIVRVGNIHRHFRETTLLHPHLIDELGSVLHTIHRETDFLDGFKPHHTVAVVRVRHPDTAHEVGKNLSSKKGESAEEGHIGISFDHEARTEHEIERRILFKRMDKSRYILDMMLPIRVKSHDILYAQFLPIPTDVLKPGLQSRTATAIKRMMHDMETPELRENFEGVVSGSIVYHKNMLKTSIQNGPDNRDNTGRFVVRPNQEYNLRTMEKLVFRA